jgi:predicted enzyme related to lactoylglutathione lyase
VNLNSILIGSDNAERLVEYYTKLFGEPGWKEGGFNGWQIGSGFVSIGPHSQVHGQNPQPGRMLWNIESADVPADFERLQAAGATVVQAPYHPGEAPDVWIATFSDPDDNYFQLMSAMSM